MHTPAARRHASALGLALLLGGSGVLHLVRPQAYAPLIPHRLGPPRPWVLGSGIAELACAAAVAVPATRRLGGYASAALLVAVLPGNVTMAVRSDPGARPPAMRHPVLAWARVPLQVPLVRWALAVAADG
ncbi:DoxX family protein [Cellulomonas sp. URHB0016]